MIKENLNRYSVQVATSLRLGRMPNTCRASGLVQPKAYFVESVILDPGDALSGLVDEFMQDFAAFLK